MTWGVTVAASNSSQLLCSSIAGVVVCTVDGNLPNMTAAAAAGSGAAGVGGGVTPNDGHAPDGVLGIDADSGKIAWRSSAISSTAAHALLLDGSSIALASDGSVYAGYTLFAGKPLGPPTPMPGNNGGAFALSSTDNGVVMLLQRSGVVAGYLTNGIVHASILLAGSSPAGAPGLFVPLGAPVVVEAVPGEGRNRVVFVTAFHPSSAALASSAAAAAAAAAVVPAARAAAVEDSGGELGAGRSRNSNEDHHHDDHDNTTNICRVYAVDVHRTIDKRFTVAWYFELACDIDVNHGACLWWQCEFFHRAMMLVSSANRGGR
jgi:hypothetical protein